MTNREWTNATMETWVAPGMLRCIDLSFCNETLFNRFGASMMPLTYIFHGRQFITIGGAYIHNTWCYYVLYVREGFWAPFSIDAIVHWIELAEWCARVIEIVRDPEECVTSTTKPLHILPPVFGTREGMSFSKVQTCRPIQRPSNICECSSPLCGGLFFSVQTSKLNFW